MKEQEIYPKAKGQRFSDCKSLLSAQHNKFKNSYTHDYCVTSEIVRAAKTGIGQRDKEDCFRKKY